MVRVLALMKRKPEHYGTQQKLAERTGLDQKSWSNYLRGKCLPGDLARERIHRKLGVRPELWDRTAKPRNDPNGSSRNRKGSAVEIASPGPVLDCSEEYSQDRPSITGVGV